MFLIIEFHKIQGTIAGPEVKAKNKITRNLELSRFALLYRRRCGLSQHMAKCYGIEISIVGIRESDDTGKCFQGKPHRIIFKKMCINGRLET